MIYRIKKGRRRAWPPRIGLLYNPKKMCRSVYLGLKSAYTLPSSDQADINKFFGWGYLDSKTILTYNRWHRTDSARWGWAYNPDTDKNDYSSYCYVNKERIYEKLFSANRTESFNLYLDIVGKNYVFKAQNKFNKTEIIKPHSVPFTHNKKWAYGLGCVFGGTFPAPIDFEIQIKKI
jgi:hypothetical protein